MTNPEKQSLIEHLEELRWRVIICIVAVFICAAVSFSFSDDVIKKMEDDLIGKYNINQVNFKDNDTLNCTCPCNGYGLQSGNVIVTSPMEGVSTLFNVSIFLGIYLSIPLIIYQLFSFVSPALYKKEKRIFIIILPVSFLLFTSGALFTYVVILPMMMSFFMAFSAPVAVSLFKLSELVSFVVMMMLIMGLIFQWPLVTAVLSKLGILSPKLLSDKRKHAIIICFILGGFLTPDPTVISQTMLAIPMIILYEIGILTAKISRSESK